MGAGCLCWSKSIENETISTYFNDDDIHQHIFLSDRLLITYKYDILKYSESENGG